MTSMHISRPVRSAARSMIVASGVFGTLALTNAGLMRASHPHDVPTAPVDTANNTPPGADNWTLAFARPAAGKYEDFAFPDTANGWLISASGVILHTTDGGASWNEQAKGNPRLRSIDFIDAKRGFAGTLTGKLLAITDGGATWTDIAQNLPHAAKGFCGMTHVGEQMHVVGAYTGAVTDYLFSPDAGKTWQHQDLSKFAQGLVDVSFINRNIGFIGGSEHSVAPGQGPALIMKTTDGGKNW